MLPIDDVLFAIRLFSLCGAGYFVIAALATIVRLIADLTRRTN